MNFIKAAAITALATTALVGTAPKASAEAYDQCGNLAGVKVCAIDRTYVDTLHIHWSDGDFTGINVECDRGGYWQIVGYHPGNSTVNAMVNQWCF